MNSSGDGVVDRSTTRGLYFSDAGEGYFVSVFAVPDDRVMTA
jgi:hypothetical protein